MSNKTYNGLSIHEHFCMYSLTDKYRDELKKKSKNSKALLISAGGNLKNGCLKYMLDWGGGPAYNIWIIF